MPTRFEELLDKFDRLDTAPSAVIDIADWNLIVALKSYDD